MTDQHCTSSERIHWILNGVTLLLIYSYVKQSLQFPPILTLFFTFVSVGIWAYRPILNTNGYNRLAYILPCYFIMIFALSFSQAIKNQGGHKGGLDDGKWIVKHRSCFQWIIYSIFSHLILKEYQQREQNAISPKPQSKSAVYRDIMSALSAPVSICSGGACHSFYASTITSILSSFSLPLAIITPFLNLLVYALQIMGLVSLYSVKGVRYAPLWLFFVGFAVQFVLEYALISSALMISGVVWNMRKNKFMFGKKSSVV